MKSSKETSELPPDWWFISARHPLDSKFFTSEHALSNPPPLPHLLTHDYTATDGVAMVIINTNHQRIVVTMATVGAAEVMRGGI